VKRYLLKELKEFIPLRKDTVRSVGHSTESLENLCPSCFVPLPKGLIACPKCKVNLKEPRRAFFKSLVLPGWGDIYLGHRALGILELIGSVIVWVFVIYLSYGEKGLYVGERLTEHLGVRRWSVEYAKEKKPVRPSILACIGIPRKAISRWKPPAAVLLASFSRFTRFCALILELFDPLQRTRVRSAHN
jgi:hypothetical protein